MDKFRWLNITVGALLLALTNPATAQDCPAAGARFVIKGFTGDTGVTATGGNRDRTYGCKWQTDDGRELWWKMGSDVVPRTAAAPSQPAGKAPPVAHGRNASPLAPGNVYECTLPGIGLFTGAYFGIVDGSSYRNIDGKQGRYAFDAATGVLRLTTGASAGLAYQRMPEGTFRMLDAKGAITGGNCVHNRAKRVDGRW